MPGFSVRSSCALTGLLLLLATSTSLPAQTITANSGSACVVAKHQGHSQAIEWIIGAPNVDIAIQHAKKALKSKGYRFLFPQANSPIDHGWAIIIKTQYRNPRGKTRTSYGCGFSPISEQDALRLAVIDLRSYSWAWRPEQGFEILKTLKF